MRSCLHLKPVTNARSTASPLVTVHGAASTATARCHRGCTGVVVWSVVRAGRNGPRVGTPDSLSLSLSRGACLGFPALSQPPGLSGEHRLPAPHLTSGDKSGASCTDPLWAVMLPMILFMALGCRRKGLALPTLPAPWNFSPLTSWLAKPSLGLL